VHNACLLFSPEGPSVGNQFKLMVLEVWGIGALTGSRWKGDMGRAATGRAQRGGCAHTVIIYSNQTVGISSMISVHPQSEVATNQAIHPVSGPLGPT
jgi:hypothetical protein